MGTVTIIVIGLVALTIVAVVGDGLTKVGLARAKMRETAKPEPAELASLNRRISILESRLDEKEESLRKLQDELRFVTRMLEDKSGAKV